MTEAMPTTNTQDAAGRGRLEPSQWRRWGRRLAYGLLGLFALSLVWAGLYRFVPPPGTLLMVQRDLAGETINYQWASYTEISPHLPLAAIAAEDWHFCRHWGFDLGAIREAVNEARAGKGLRGASTITQQTAKNSFLWNGGGFFRKVIEAVYTVEITILWSKRRTMEVYLNIAEFGDGLFGVEAASRRRFGKPASELTRREAALLVAVLPSPNRWRLDPPTDYVRGRARRILERMKVIENQGNNKCVW